jgi:hypothetical protein
MFFKTLWTLCLSCRYQPAHRELYVVLAKALVAANVVWLMGNMIASSALGIAAHSAELLIFYVIFSSILSIISTVVIKRAVSKVHLTFTELVHQSRSVFLIQLGATAFLMLLVSMPCLMAAFVKVLRSVPVLGYFFRQVYEAIEPLFMFTLFFVFLGAIFLPLITPFLFLLVKQTVHHWREVFFAKMYPRFAGSLSTLMAAFFLWFLVEAAKISIEWIFPVGGFLSALIRSSFYAGGELFVFWTSLNCFLHVARSKV